MLLIERILGGIMPVQKIDFSNLGKIKKGSISLNNLTILTGPNNSGKTYIVYILYGFYKNINRLEFSSVRELLSELLNEGIVKIHLEDFIIKNLDSIKHDANKYLKYSLNRIFNQQDDSIFTNTEFDICIHEERIREIFSSKKFVKRNTEIKMGNEKKAIELSYDEVSRELSIVVFNKDLPKELIASVISNFISTLLFNLDQNEIFILPAERAGLNLFYKELNANRNALIESIVNLEKAKKINPFDLIMNMTSKYPQPISEYIHFLNNMDSTKKRTSEFKHLSQKINKKILDGSYKVKEDEIYFRPYKSNGVELKLHVASSTTKSLFGLNYYLEHIAKSGDFLFIDEPELNLHPDNHRILARLICNIVNEGVKVILSTHSDHFIKEINNLIMLSEDFPKRDSIMTKYKYSSDELLSSDNISAYLVDKKTIKQIPINQEEGIIESTFDDAINEFNTINDDIYYSKLGDFDE